MLGKWSRVGAAVMLFSIGTCVGCANEQETARRAVPASFPATADHWNDGILDHVEFLRKFQLSDYSKVVVELCDTSAVTLPAKDSNTFDAVNTVLAHSTDLLAEGLRSKLKGCGHVCRRPSDRQLCGSERGELPEIKKPAEFGNNSLDLTVWYIV